MSEYSLGHWIQGYYKQLARQCEDNKMKEQTKQKHDLIKMFIKNFMNWNKGKLVVIRKWLSMHIFQFFSKSNSLKSKPQWELFLIKDSDEFGWRKVTQHLPKFYQNSL